MEGGREEKGSSMWLDRRKGEERKMRKKQEEQFHCEMYMYYYFLIYWMHINLCFEGMKIISRSSWTVGIGGSCRVDNGTL